MTSQPDASFPIAVTVTAFDGTNKWGAHTVVSPHIVNDGPTLVTALPIIVEHLTHEMEQHTDAPRIGWRWRAVEALFNCFTEEESDDAA